jgi:hypothetical protein
VFLLGVGAESLARTVPEPDEPVAAYEKPIELAPRFSDARFYVSPLYEELGIEVLAIQHLRGYKDLTESG